MPAYGEPSFLSADALLSALISEAAESYPPATLAQDVLV